MSKKNIIIVVAVLIVVIGGALWMKKVNGDNGYSVVYMSTGEIYVGKLQTFPDFELKGAYILQIAQDATDPKKANFQLTPVSEALWAPEVMNLNEKNIVFHGPLLPTSKIAETLATKAK